MVDPFEMLDATQTELHEKLSHLQAQLDAQQDRIDRSGKQIADLIAQVQAKITEINADRERYLRLRANWKTLLDHRENMLIAILAQLYPPGRNPVWNSDTIDELRAEDVASEIEGLQREADRGVDLSAAMRLLSADKRDVRIYHDRNNAPENRWSGHTATPASHPFKEHEVMAGTLGEVLLGLADKIRSSEKP